MELSKWKHFLIFLKKATKVGTNHVSFHMKTAPISRSGVVIVMIMILGRLKSLGAQEVSHAYKCHQCHTYNVSQHSGD